MEQAKEFSETGLYFGSKSLSWETAIVVSVTDASFAQETINEPDGQVKPHRTQKAFMNLLVNPEILMLNKEFGFLAHWHCAVQK